MFEGSTTVSSDIPVCTRIEEAMQALATATTVFLDTETASLTGLCFLIQFATKEDPGTVYIIKVWKELPHKVVELIAALSTKVIIVHNGSFDLFHLGKLFTISKLVPNYSFNEIWKAERIFRPQESSYEERLQCLYSFYPQRVIDTLLVARHTLPLADVLIKKSSYKIYGLPYQWCAFHNHS